MSEKSHEKAGNHWNDAHRQRDVLRGPSIRAFLETDCRFGRAGYGGCPGRAARNARQRRWRGAQSYTALRRRRYLLVSAEKSEICGLWHGSACAWWPY